MNKPLQVTLIIITSCAVLYLGAFYFLGRLAPNNAKINEFYSSKFYGLRQWKEAAYLNKLEIFDGELYFNVNNEPGLLLSDGSAIGFTIPDHLKERVFQIPSGSEIQIHVGKTLDKKSVGMYWNELREIRNIHNKTESGRR